MKPLCILSKLCMAVIVWGLAVGTYWEWFDHTNPVTKLEMSIINPGPIHPGDNLIINSDYCVIRPPVPGSAVRSISDGFSYRLSDITVRLETGCFQRAFQVKLPNGISPGKYTYKFSIIYQINPLKQSVFTSPGIPFTVVAKNK